MKTPVSYSGNYRKKLFKALLLFAFVTLGLSSQAQSLSGLWVGNLRQDSTSIRKDQSFEIALTEYKGKVYGYSRSEFVINDTLYYILKRVKGTIKGDVCEVTDDEIVSYNFRGKLDKGVKVTSTFRRNKSDSTWYLDGTWKTNATRKFYAVTGKVSLEEDKDLSASKIFPHLEELNKADQFAFYKEHQQKKNTPAPRQVRSETELANRFSARISQQEATAAIARPVGEIRPGITAPPVVTEPVASIDETKKGNNGSPAVVSAGKQPENLQSQKAADKVETVTTKAADPVMAKSNPAEPVMTKVDPPAPVSPSVAQTNISKIPGKDSLALATSEKQPVNTPLVKAEEKMPAEPAKDMNPPLAKSNPSQTMPVPGSSPSAVPVTEKQPGATTKTPDPVAITQQPDETKPVNAPHSVKTPVVTADTKKPVPTQPANPPAQPVNAKTDIAVIATTPANKAVSVNKEAGSNQSTQPGQPVATRQPIEPASPVITNKNESNVSGLNPVVASVSPDLSKNQPVTPVGASTTSTTIPPVVSAQPAPVTPASPLVQSGGAVPVKPLPNPQEINTVAGRRSEYSQQVTFSADSLVIVLFDNGEIDGDTVSVYLNGELIMPRQGLKASAIRKTIAVPREVGSFSIVMFAETLGTRPPNTGLLVVHDGEETYYVRFSSDFQKSTGILFKRKQ